MLENEVLTTLTTNEKCQQEQQEQQQQQQQQQLLPLYDLGFAAGKNIRKIIFTTPSTSIPLLIEFKVPLYVYNLINC